MSDSGANHQPWAYYPSNGRDTGDQIPTTRYRSNSNSNGSTNFPQRKKLELKPRTVSSKVTPQNHSSPSNNNDRKSNPFGAAKPREEVLASKGIDAKLVDLRIQKKSAVTRYTKAQEIELEKVRGELSSAEKRWREANEKELPEEEYRVLTEAKRKELSELMKKFAEENNSKSDETTRSDGITKLERPSERRKRLELQGQPNRPKSNSFDKPSGGGYSGYNQHHGGKGFGESSENSSRGSMNKNNNNNYHNRNKNYRGNNDDDAYASFGRNRNYSGRRGDNERRQF